MTIILLAKEHIFEISTEQLEASQMKILAIAGSLRTQSSNAAFVRAINRLPVRYLSTDSLAAVVARQTGTNVCPWGVHCHKSFSTLGLGRSPNPNRANIT